MQNNTRFACTLLFRYCLLPAFLLWVGLAAIDLLVVSLLAMPFNLFSGTHQFFFWLFYGLLFLFSRILRVIRYLRCLPHLHMGCPNCALPLLPETTHCPRCKYKQPILGKGSSLKRMYRLPRTWIQGENVSQETIADVQENMEKGLQAMAFTPLNFHKESAWMHKTQKDTSLWARILYTDDRVVLCLFYSADTKYGYNTFRFCASAYLQNINKQYAQLVALANGNKINT